MPFTELNFHVLINWAMKQRSVRGAEDVLHCSKQLLNSAAGHEEPRMRKERAFWETFLEGKVTQPHGNAVVYQAVKSIAIHLLCTVACSRQTSSLAWPVSCIQNSFCGLLLASDQAQTKQTQQAPSPTTTIDLAHVQWGTETWGRRVPQERQLEFTVSGALLTLGFENVPAC